MKKRRICYIMNMIWTFKYFFSNILPLFFVHIFREGICEERQWNFIISAKLLSSKLLKQSNFKIMIFSKICVVPDSSWLLPIHRTALHRYMRCRRSTGRERQTLGQGTSSRLLLWHQIWTVRARNLTQMRRSVRTLN